MSEPKPQVVFEAVTQPLSLTKFRTAIGQHGLRLSARSKLLHDEEFAYLNGEFMSDNRAPDWPFWKELSKNQRLKKSSSGNLASLLNDIDNPWYEAYLAGWLIFHD